MTKEKTKELLRQIIEFYVDKKDKDFWKSEDKISQLLEKYELLKRELSGKKAVVITKEQELNKDVAFLMDMFKEVNPSYIQLFKHKPQRESVKRLLEKMDFDKVAELIDLLQQTNKMQYAPVITTPSQLENKLGALIAFISREKIARKNNDNIVVI
jgi:arsenate reductase-like glutaredoxin family protein